MRSLLKAPVAVSFGFSEKAGLPAYQYDEGPGVLLQDLFFFARAGTVPAQQQVIERYGTTGTPRTPSFQGVRYAYQRDSEVVQRCQGLWLHHTGRWQQGLLRPSQRHPGKWLQVIGRG